MKLEFSSENQKFMKHLNELAEKVTPAAVVAALNSTGTQVTREAIKIASRETGVDRKTLRRRIVMPKAKKANRRRLHVTIYGGLWPVRVVKLKPAPRELKSGRVKYKTMPGKQVDPQAFMAPTSNGGVGVFKRKGPPRLPIKSITIEIGPYVRRSITRYARSSEARQHYDKTFLKQMDRKVRASLIRQGMGVS